MKWLLLLPLALSAGLLFSGPYSSDEFRFVILGDRTGGALPNVYEEAWRQADADRPDFAITVGDTIQGGNDVTVDAEWQEALRALPAQHPYQIFFVPGNHDVWSTRSAKAFERYTKHPLRYSFDYRQAHFTVLDNSRSDALSPEDLAFLEQDLSAHQAQPLKFVFSHRPSWILQAVLLNPNFPLHRLAKRYGVQYVIAGHIHQMLRFDLDGVTYVSMASSGGHLRASKRYDQGWFFQHTLATVHGTEVNFAIKELEPPFGQARVSELADWGPAGLSRAPGAE
ncbi:MAG TPA: metallophosphoesterase [Bryobacteraceae bacterium]|jgi:UDP-2,3-diacylglucosamine pyrophosphatase LpxH|nr:metallophosphoesterase [Bryobacteraceae bacterium]